MCLNKGDLRFLRSRHILEYTCQTYKYLDTYRAVFISTVYRQENTMTRIIIFFVLFAYSIGDHVHPQGSKQCLLNSDLHLALTKLNCKLVKATEEMAFFKGTWIKIRQIFQKQSGWLLSHG